MTRVPRRIQRKRTKGWRMPDGTAYVGRPTRWGNPWRVGERDPEHPDNPDYPRMDAARVTELYAQWINHGPDDEVPDLTPLIGRDLACWCPLDRPCHADVLLRFANGGGQ